VTGEWVDENRKAPVESSGARAKKDDWNIESLKATGGFLKCGYQGTTIAGWFMSWKILITKIDDLHFTPSWVNIRTKRSSNFVIDWILGM
jgi:hypothetical protein